MVDKKQLEQELNNYKAMGYDILANMEVVEINYRNSKQELQNKLNQVNQQITAKSQLIQAQEQPVEETVSEEKTLLQE
jgi:hypothetical protein